MRKMLVAMAKDPRVLLIKLADRLHNMQTIAAMPEWKQKRTRPGDPRHLRPAGPPLRDPGHQVAARGPGLRHPASPPLRRDRADGRHPRPRAGHLPGPGHRPGQRAAGRRPHRRRQVTGRPKHLYSIYEKMVVKGKEFDEIYDLVGVRVLVDSVKDCWAALGAIHGAWTPVQGRFKDYINTPKFNLYQSLHTTVVGPAGQAPRGPDPHPRDAQPGRVGDRRPLGLQGEGVGGRRGLAAAHRRLVGGEHRPGRVPRDPEARPRDRTRSSCSPPRATWSPCRCTPRRSTSPTPSTPRSATAASGPGSTAGWCRSTPQLALRRQRRDLHLQGALRRPEPGLAEDRRQPTGPQQDPPVVQPGAPRGRHRDRAGGADQGAAQGGPARPEADQLAGPGQAGRVDELRRPRRPARRHRRESRVGPVRSPSGWPASCAAATTRSSCRAPPASPAGSTSARASASTSRVSTTSWSACPGAAPRCPATRSSAS